MSYKWLFSHIMYNRSINSLKVHKGSLKRCKYSTTSLKNTFVGEKDRFNGVTVDTCKEKCEPDNFASKLNDSLNKWLDEGKRCIWFKVNIKDSIQVPILANKGFTFHHAREDSVIMCKWLPMDSEANLPPASHTNLGVGAMVFNKKDQLLAVSEKHYEYPHWKLPGGYVESAYAPVSSACAQELEKFWESVRDVLDLADGNERVIMCGDLNGWVGTKRDGYEAVLGPYGDKRVNEAGEDILDAAVREVKEETGVDATFESLVTFRHTHNMMYGNSDIYILLMMNALSETISISQREVKDCKWMEIDEYVNHPHVHEFNKLIVQTALQHKTDKIKLNFKKISVRWATYVRDTSYLSLETIDSNK